MTKRDEKWNARLEVCKQWKQTKGRFPKGNQKDKEEWSLYNWLRECKPGGKSWTQARWEKLNEAFGEGWEKECFPYLETGGWVGQAGNQIRNSANSKDEAKWGAILEAVKLFKRTHGRFPRYSGGKDERRLYECLRKCSDRTMQNWTQERANKLVLAFSDRWQSECFPNSDLVLVMPNSFDSRNSFSQTRLHTHTFLRCASKTMPTSNKDPLRATPSHGLRRSHVLAFAGGVAFLIVIFSLSLKGAFPDLALGSSGVPKIIHQSWKTTQLREDHEVWQHSWIDANPGWKYMFWTDLDNRQLVADFYPDLLYTYDILPKNITRADFVRALYMHKYGGVYADLDTWCLRPVDTLLTAGPGIAYVAEMGPDLIYEHNIPNAWYASSPGHPFWLFFAERVVELTQNVVDGRRGWPGIEGIAGPVMLKAALDSWNDVHSFIGLDSKVETIKHGRVYVLDWHANDDSTNPWKMYAKSRNERLKEECPGKDLHTEAVQQACKEAFPDAVVLTYWTHTW